MGAVRKVKVGRNVRIELTPLGVFLVKGAGGVGLELQYRFEHLKDVVA